MSDPMKCPKCGAPWTVDATEVMLDGEPAIHLTARLDVARGSVPSGTPSFTELRHVVDAYVTDAKPEGWTDSPRAIVLAALERAVSVGAAAREAAPSGLTPIQELAQAAQDYLNSQSMVGHTEESQRRLHYRLGCLIGPHLVAYQSGARSPLQGEGDPQ